MSCSRGHKAVFTSVLTLRGAEREGYGPRGQLSRAVHRGELPGYTLPGSRAIYLRRLDIEKWWRRHLLRPNAFARAVVDARLDHEADPDGRD